MPLCWMHPSRLSNKSPRREILLHVQRMKSFLSVRPKCTVFLNKSVYTVLSCVKHAIYLFILVCTRLCLKCLFSIGWQLRFGWICSSWHQPLKTQQTRVWTGSCSPFDSAGWGCSTSVVGVYLQDSPPCPALAAYKVGWVDRGEHAGGARVSR